jgi:hypothetical protein
MKPRELAALLKNLRANGVTRYAVSAAGDVSITFGDTPMQEAASAGGDQEQEDGPLLVPAGVFDPLAKLREINAKQRGPS